MKTEPTPLKFKIPGDYAAKLGIHFTSLSKINAGERQIALDKACLLMKLAKSDPRLKGMTIYDLRPELLIARPHLCPRKRRIDE